MRAAACPRSRDSLLRPCAYALRCELQVMQKELVYEGAPLKMEPRAAYVQRKQDERHARPNSPHNQMDVGAIHLPPEPKQPIWSKNSGLADARDLAPPRKPTGLATLCITMPSPRAETCHHCMATRRLNACAGLPCAETIAVLSDHVMVVLTGLQAHTYRHVSGITWKVLLGDLCHR